jgi:ATP-dependent DNA helicase RecG
MRGPGDLSGTRQSGLLKFKLADIVADGAILEQTRQAAQMIINEDPALTSPQHQGIRNILLQEKAQNNWAKIS